MRTRSLLLLACLAAACSCAFAADTATQSVTWEVAAINEISIAGAPSLLVNAATAGSQPDAATTTATYNITTNATGKKITGEIEEDMPAGVTLSLTLAAPTGGASAGKKALSTTPADLVTGVATVAEQNKLMTYELAATVAAGILVSDTRTVTLTITE